MRPDTRTWPQGVRPTPEQFADWIVTLDRDHRVSVATAVLRSSEDAHRCLVQNHDSQVSHWRRSARDAEHKLVRIRMIAEAEAVCDMHGTTLATGCEECSVTDSLNDMGRQIVAILNEPFRPERGAE